MHLADCLNHLTSGEGEVHQEGPDRITATLDAIRTALPTLPAGLTCV